jgi:L-threonylcarbamoyladenylate synthase
MKAVDLAGAVAALKRGAALIYPTETFYGLGVDITQAPAVQRLFEIKGRDFSKPVSVLVGSNRHIQDLVSELSTGAKKLIDGFLPGPLTLVLPAAARLHPKLHGGTGWIGIRWSSHPLAQALVEALGNPITATSANPSGAPEGGKAEDFEAYFKGEPDLYFLPGGDLPPSRGSTVVKVEGEQLTLIRQGDIAFARIEKIFKDYV